MEGCQELSEPGGFVFDGRCPDQMGHGLADWSFVLKTRGREEGRNECEEKAETSQIP